jgi:hypothetical protein
MAPNVNGHDESMECRDDGPSTIGPKNLDAETKPLFRSTSPEKSYAAESPYYDVLLYSFTPEKQREENETTMKFEYFENEKKQFNRTKENTKRKSTTATIREQLERTGTNLHQNDHDIIGDGDQSPIIDTQAHAIYMDIFHTGT